MNKTKSPYGKRKVTTLDEDVALIGKCQKHPDSGLKVVQWRDVYYFMDSGEIDKWVEDEQVYFLPEKAHAFFVKIFE